MTTAAAWVAAAALWLGALAPGPWWLALFGVAVLVAAGLAGRAAVPGRRPRTLTAVAVALVLVGSALAGGRVALRDGGPLPALAASGGTAEMTARVVTETRPTEPAPWQTAAAEPGWLLVRVTRLDGRGVRERALVRVDDVDDAPALGERLRLTASARPLDTDGFGGYVRRRHAAVALDPQALEVVAPPGPALAATNHVRQRTRDAYARHLDEEHAGLLAGLVVGERRGRSPERADQFAAAGLSHLVVVSGRHVALMLAGVLATCVVARVGARSRRWVGLAALFWFAVLVRWQPSVLRASTMGGLVLGAGLLGRGSEPRHHLAVAVTLLLLADPLLAGQVGFALSVLATAGVLGLSPWLAQRLPGPRPVRLLVAVTIGAQLGAAPVLLAAFDRLPLASVPANLVAVPAAALAQTVGMAAAVVAQASVAAGGWTAAIAQTPLSLILWAAETFSRGPAVRVPDLWSPFALILVAALLLAHYRPRMAAWLVALVVAVAALPLGGPLAGRPGPVTAPRLTAFDVGQGDALLVEIPGDPPTRLLYDGGPEPEAALDHLRGRGVDALDVVVASHPHHDHVAGLPAVLENLAVGALLVAPLSLDEYEERLVGPARRLPRVARDAGVAVTPASAGRRFELGQATVEVLSPPDDDSLGGDPNENSLVMRIHTRAGRILLTGDAEAAAQQRLLDEPERLRADLVQVPHHGGATNADGFLEAVAPDVAVISVGAENDHGHPHPRVLAELTGVVTKRTDEHGTVTAALPQLAQTSGQPPEGTASRSASDRPPGRGLAGRVRGCQRERCRRHEGGRSSCATSLLSASFSHSASSRARVTGARPRPRSVWRTPPTQPPTRAPPLSP